MIKETLTLFVMQIKLYRQIGLMAIVISALLPLGLIFLLRFVFPAIPADYLLYFISGNLTLSLMTVCIIMLSQSLAQMRQIKSFEYYAVLPINKLSLVLSIIFSFFIMCMPGFLILVIVASFLFNFQFIPHPAFIIIVILTIFSLSGIGAILGVYTRHFMQTNLLSQIFGFGLMVITPVFYPIDILPEPVQILSLFFPTTYAAESFRITLRGEFTSELYPNIFALILFATISFYLVSKKITFREI